MSVIVKSL